MSSALERSAALSFLLLAAALPWSIAPMSIGVALCGALTLAAWWRPGGVRWVRTPVDPAALVRKPILVTIVLPGGGERIVHGMVSRFTQLGRRAGLSAYKADVVPWLWFLSLSNDCRIFQNLSVADIAEQLFTEAGCTDFEVRLLKPLAQREDGVQYRESTLAFVSRLLEEEEIIPPNIHYKT